MSGKRSRNKGARAEVEFFNALSELTGEDLKRNLAQTREGGADGLDLKDWAIEVKRREALSLEVWWQQACEQAARENRTPALAYRQNRKQWRVVVPLGSLLDHHTGYTAELSLEGFALVVGIGPYMSRMPF